MLAYAFHKQCNHRLLWVSVYIYPPKQFGPENEQEINVVVVVFCHSFFFFFYYGECQQDWDEEEGITGTVWQSPGVNQYIFQGRWIFSPGPDVIVYYPSLSVSNRELAESWGCWRAEQTLWIICPFWESPVNSFQTGGSTSKCHQWDPMFPDHVKSSVLTPWQVVLCVAFESKSLFSELGSSRSDGLWSLRLVIFL